MIHKLLKKLTRYFFTGGFAAITDLVCFALLVRAEMQIAPAAVISFLLAAVVNFNLTSRFVFGLKATRRDFITFLIAAIIGLVVNVCITLLGVMFFNLPPLIAKLLGTATAFFINFWLNMGLVFRRNEPPIT